MCLLDFVPVKVQAPPWVAHQGLDFGPFFVVVTRLISRHLTMEQPSQIIICGGFSFATVKNESLMEIPRLVPSIRMVGR